MISLWALPEISVPEIGGSCFGSCDRKVRVVPVLLFLLNNCVVVRHGVDEKRVRAVCREVFGSLASFSSSTLSESLVNIPSLFFLRRNLIFFFFAFRQHYSQW